MQIGGRGTGIGGNRPIALLIREEKTIIGVVSCFLVDGYVGKESADGLFEHRTVERVAGGTMGITDFPFFLTSRHVAAVGEIMGASRNKVKHGISFTAQKELSATDISKKKGLK